jgi:hypothetical protein
VDLMKLGITSQVIAFWLQYFENVS